MAAEQIAVYKPGDNVGVVAKALIRAGRFVKVVGKVAATGAYEGEEAGENYDRPFGVSQRETLDPATEPARSQDLMTECVRRGAIARIVASGEVKVGEQVMVGTEGRAKKLGAEKFAVGRAVSTATDGNIVEVELY